MLVRCMQDKILDRSELEFGHVQCQEFAAADFVRSFSLLGALRAVSNDDGIPLAMVKRSKC